MSKDIEPTEESSKEELIVMPIYDAVVDEGLTVLDAPEEGMKESAAKPKPKAPAAAVKKEEEKKDVVIESAYHVVSGGEYDVVHLSKAVYKNVAAKKSLTVHHLQRRLNEIGYHDAYLDKDGWYGDHTKNAVAAFQEDKKLGGDGMMDMQTMNAIFLGDNNVRVQP